MGCDVRSSEGSICILLICPAIDIVTAETCFVIQLPRHATAWGISSAAVHVNTCRYILLKLQHPAHRNQQREDHRDVLGAAAGELRWIPDVWVLLLSRAVDMVKSEKRRQGEQMGSGHTTVALRNDIHHDVGLCILFFKRIASENNTDERNPKNVQRNHEVHWRSGRKQCGSCSSDYETQHSWSVVCVLVQQSYHISLNPFLSSFIITTLIRPGNAGNNKFGFRLVRDGGT